MNTELWGTIADWAQAVSSTVVLFLILMQMKQVNQQILQNGKASASTGLVREVTFSNEWM